MEPAMSIMTAALVDLRSKARVAPISYHLVGSSFILGEGKDVDILVLVSSQEAAAMAAKRIGYVQDCEEVYKDADFMSLRLGEVNLLLTQYPSYFENFVLAAKTCKLLKVADKADRIAVHSLIRDGIEPMTFDDLFA